VANALDRLGFDFAEIDLHLNGNCQAACCRPTGHGISVLVEGKNAPPTAGSATAATASKTPAPKTLLKLELPLLDNGSRVLGHMRLVKDLHRDAISHYTLRRVEHLRRSVMGRCLLPSALIDGADCSAYNWHVQGERSTNMPTMTIELPENIFSSLRKTPAEFIREMRIEAAAQWYSQQRISQEKGAEIAGISRAEFIDELAT
jgi:hypothetical protein